MGVTGVAVGVPGGAVGVGVVVAGGLSVAVGVGVGCGVSVGCGVAVGVGVGPRISPKFTVTVQQVWNWSARMCHTSGVVEMGWLGGLVSTMVKSAGAVNPPKKKNPV